MSKSNVNVFIRWFLMLVSCIWVTGCGPKPNTKEASTKAVNIIASDEDGNLLKGVVIEVKNVDGTFDTYTTNQDGQTSVNITRSLPVRFELSYTKEFLPISINIREEDFPANQSRIEKKIQIEKKKTTVFGFVFDKSNSKPIPGDPVRITVPDINSSGSIYTDKEGMYEIESSELFEGANLNINASVAGYNKNSVLIKIDSLWNRNKAPNILLEALPDMGNKITISDTLLPPPGSGGGFE